MQPEPNKSDTVAELDSAPIDDFSDAELLNRFIRHQDESAFAVLIERHGPMVRGVCQRSLRDPNAVDDAFQATFLILVRKAASLGKPELLANWLYGVAYRTALNAKIQAARRRHFESEAAAMSPGLLALGESRQELLAALDEAIEGLPEKYRVPLILCYLEGKTNEQAAQLLGWPAGSISARLARGRALLRDRLNGRYGEVLAGFIAAVLVEDAQTSTVPARLASNTVQAAGGLLRGKTLGVQLVSASVSSLMDETLAAMSAARLKKAVGLVLAFVLTAGVSFAASTAVVGWQDGPGSGAGPPTVHNPVVVSPTTMKNQPIERQSTGKGGACRH
jgi:RNA polymerase sigma factor (sigma-70 family)